MSTDKRKAQCISGVQIFIWGLHQNFSDLPVRWFLTSTSYKIMLFLKAYVFPVCAILPNFVLIGLDVLEKLGVTARPAGDN